MLDVAGRGDVLGVPKLDAESLTGGWKGTGIGISSIVSFNTMLVSMTGYEWML